MGRRKLSPPLQPPEEKAPNTSKDPTLQDPKTAPLIGSGGSSRSPERESQEMEGPSIQRIDRQPQFKRSIHYQFGYEFLLIFPHEQEV